MSKTDAIGGKGASSERVTLKGVASRAGVSISTASRVLSGASGISANVRDKVLAVAEELNYATIAPAARNFVILSDVATVQIGAADYMHGVMEGIEAECSELGISQRVQIVGPDSVLPTPPAQGPGAVDGYVFLSIYDNKLVDELVSRGAPAVIINGIDPMMRIDAVAPANRMGEHVAAEHLIGLGHRRILNLTFAPRATIMDRYAGYLMAMEEAGLPVDPKLTIQVEAMRTDVGYDLVRKLLAKTKTPDFTAILCCNDAVAIGAEAAVMEAGFSVPDDISIVGFDDIATSSITTRPLTTVHVDREAIGAFGIRRLAERVRNPALNVTYTEFAVKLVVRDSTGPAPQR